MSTQLDLDDVANTSQAAKSELDDLRAALALLVAERGELQKRVAAFENADTSKQPYEKGWQDGRKDAWEAYSARDAS